MSTSVYYFKKRNIHAKWSGVDSLTGGKATIGSNSYQNAFH